MFPASVSTGGISFTASRHRASAYIPCHTIPFVAVIMPIHDHTSI
jgi:hypothetical protein